MLGNLATLNLFLFEKRGVLCLVKTAFINGVWVTVRIISCKMCEFCPSMSTSAGTTAFSGFKLSLVEPPRSTFFKALILFVKDYTQLYVHICRINPNPTKLWKALRYRALRYRAQPARASRGDARKRVGSAGGETTSNYALTRPLGWAVLFISTLAVMNVWMSTMVLLFTGMSVQLREDYMNYT